MKSVPTSFWEWMNAIQPEERNAVVILATFALLMAIIVISGVIYKMHKNRLEDALKRELMERGMSAQEIATVIRAKASRPDQCGPHTT